MKRLAYILLLALLCCQAAAQTSWDASLDKYEYICRRCLILKDAISEGEVVPADSIRALSSELVSLGSALQKTSGSMSPFQKRRFALIRKMYLTGSTRDLELPLLERPESICSDASSGISSSPIVPSINILPPEPQWHTQIMVAPVFGVLPDFTAGLMASVDLGRRVGIYVKGMSNFRAYDPSYSCLSSGQIVGGGKIWATGKTAVSRFSISGGLLWHTGRMVSIYAGSGYGSRSLFWEDSSGKWAQVQDALSRGPVADAGIVIAPFGEMRLIAGGSFIFPAKAKVAASLEIGLGWAF